MTPEPVKSMNRTPLRPVWSSEGEIPEPLYADQLHVLRVGDAFHLTFGQVTVPIGVQPEPGSPTKVRQVARLVIAKEAFHQMADLFQRVKADTTKEG